MRQIFGEENIFFAEEKKNGGGKYLEKEKLAQVDGTGRISRALQEVLAHLKSHKSIAICHLPLATYHSPLATCHLPLAIGHLPLATCHLPLATCHFPLATCFLPLARMQKTFTAPAAYNSIIMRAVAARIFRGEEYSPQHISSLVWSIGSLQKLILQKYSTCP